MNNLFDKAFGAAFLSLDSQQKNLDELSIKQKIQALEIIKKATDEKIKMYSAELRYRENIYKSYKRELI